MSRQSGVKVLSTAEDYAEARGKLHTTKPKVDKKRDSLNMEIQHEDYGPFLCKLVAMIKFAPSRFKNKKKGNQEEGPPSMSLVKIGENVLNSIRNDPDLSDEFKAHLVQKFEDANEATEAFIEMMSDEHENGHLRWAMKNADVLYKDTKSYNYEDERDRELFTDTMKRVREFLKFNKAEDGSLDRSSDPLVQTKFKYYPDYDKRTQKPFGPDKVQGVRYGFHTFRLEGVDYEDDESETNSDSGAGEEKDGGSEEEEEGSDSESADEPEYPEVIESYEVDVETYEDLKNFLRYNDVASVVFELKRSTNPDQSFTSTSANVKMVQKYEVYKMMSRVVNVDDVTDEFVTKQSKKKLKPKARVVEEEEEENGDSDFDELG